MICHFWLTAFHDYCPNTNCEIQLVLVVNDYIHREGGGLRQNHKLFPHVCVGWKYPCMLRESCNTCKSRRRTSFCLISLKNGVFMKEYLLFCMHVLNGWFDIPLKKHFPQSGLIERWKLTKQNDIPLKNQKQNDIPQNRHF